jgi:hypothetical protein
MGLLKKYLEKAAAKMPAYGAEIAAVLPAGETVVGWGQGMHLAPLLDMSVRRQGIIGVGINAASEKLKANKHLAGDDGSCAHAIPRDAYGFITVAVTNQRVTMWSFGQMMQDIPPTELISFPLSSLAAIEKTGESDKYGPHVRFRFVDASHVDFAMMPDPANETFFAAAAAVGHAL